MFIHSPADGNLGCFHSLAMQNNATMNICVQLFCGSTCFHFSWVKLPCHMITLCLTFWETVRLLSKVAALFYNLMRVPISLYPCPNLLLSFFLIITILVDVKRYFLIVVLIFITIMASDVECLFIDLLALCLSSLEKCLFKSFAHC